MKPATKDIPLDVLELLVVDCQTTGATPQKAHLLELAWARVGNRPAPVTAHLVRLPRGARLPTRVAKMTGISKGDLEASGLPAGQVWRQLEAEASSLASGVAVAHFASFERRFLTALSPDGALPFSLYCTHEIARRALAALPRRGLRALAGYFGYVMRAANRAGCHVEATVAVWRGLIPLLAREGVTTLAELERWSAAVPAAHRGGREVPLERAARLELPDSPGVYRLCARGGEVLYVGKATSLRRRVNSYFQKRRHDRRITPELLTQTFNVEVTVTGSALEAALFEADEIKRQAPPYNRALSRLAGPTFASPDLRCLQQVPDANHALGPLPSDDLMQALNEAATLCREASALPAGRCARTLASPRVESLDPDLWLAGVARLASPASLTRPASWLRLGVRLWRERIEAGPAAEADESAPDDEPRSTQPETPEAVAEALGEVALRAAHQLRRARWLCALSEATVVWRRGEHHRLLIVVQGRVRHSEELETGDVLPWPPWGHWRAPGFRRQLFVDDPAAYDRLRVLTTELKRLVRERRLVWLCLGTDRGQLLDGSALARRLWWL